MTKEISHILEVNGVNLEELTETVIRRAAEENRPQWDVLKEELLKIAQGQTDQSKAQEHNKKINTSITSDKNLINGGVKDGSKKNVFYTDNK